MQIDSVGAERPRQTSLQYAPGHQIWGGSGRVLKIKRLSLGVWPARRTKAAGGGAEDIPSLYFIFRGGD